jgi:phosphatidylglycerol:prolipoprotein diacylglycerol transferase
MHVLFDEHLMDYVHMCTEPLRIVAEDPPVAHCIGDAQCGTVSACEQAGAWGAIARMAGLCSGYFLCGADGACHPPRDCLVAFKAWRGGLAFYGGFIFAALYAVRFLRRRHLSFLKVADLMSPLIALGLFFGRVGCWLNGCCFGKVCDAAWGVVFPRGSGPWREQLEHGLIHAREAALPVYPAQLWQAALNLAAFAALYFWFRPRKRFDGQVFAWLLILKAVTRSTVEAFRDDERGVFFGGLLSTSQIISGFMVILACVLLARLRERRVAAGGYA